MDFHECKVVLELLELASGGLKIHLVSIFKAFHIGIIELKIQASVDGVSLRIYCFQWVLGHPRTPIYIFSDFFGALWFSWKFGALPCILNEIFIEVEVIVSFKYDFHC